MGCDFLKLQSNDTDFAALLQFVTELPGAMRPALVRDKHFSITQILWRRRTRFVNVRILISSDLFAVSPAKMHCWWTEETPRTWPQRSELWICYNITVSTRGFILLSAVWVISRWLCLKLFLFYSVTMLEDLSNSSFRAIQDHIQTHLTYFLKLPHYKQTYLAEKVIAKLVCINLLVFCAPGFIFCSIPVRNPKDRYDRQICDSYLLNEMWIPFNPTGPASLCCSAGLFSSWGTDRWPRSGFPGTSAAFLRPGQLSSGGQRSSGSETGGDEKFLPP